MVEWIKCTVITALLVGVCDYAIGFGIFVAVFGRAPIAILQHPASAVLGPAAYEGGLATAALGVGFHFLVALIWSVAYVVLYRTMPALRSFTSSTSGLLIAAVVVGVVVWVIMNNVVLPLSLTRPYPVDSGLFWVIIAGHIPFVGLPLVWSVRRFCPMTLCTSEKTILYKYTKAPLMRTKRIHKIRNLAAPLALALAFFAVPTRADDVAFRHVTVVDVVSGRLVRDQVVRISGERIVEVLPAAGARIPKGTRIVDAKGKFLIPGLWDMHTHLLGGVPPGCPELTFLLTVAHGVTGVREVGSYLDFVHAWREEVEAGRIVGPRIVGTGPLIDGVPPVFPGIAIVAKTPVNARQTVDILARRGADFVKAYEMLGRDAFFALVEQAKKNGLRVVAHVPLTVLAGEASDAGVRSFEHLRNIEFACSREADILLAERIAALEAGAGRIGNELRTEIHSAQQTRALDTYDPERCTSLLRKFVANGTWQTPTLFLNTREVRRPDLREDMRETLRWMPAPKRAEWEAWTKRVSGMKPDEAAVVRRLADWQIQLVRRMNEEGVGLLAGTDVAIAWMVPGVALHDELSALVEAGLTPLESLRTATLNPARYFEKTTEFGSVAKGLAADLVLLDGDPLADIRNTRRISAVVANGRYLDRPALDAMLATVERLARSGEHDLIHRPSRTARTRTTKHP